MAASETLQAILARDRHPSRFLTYYSTVFYLANGESTPRPQASRLKQLLPPVFADDPYGDQEEPEFEYANL
jgi:hypothetical protein